MNAFFGSFGSNVRFATVRLASTTYSWRAYQDGAALATYDLSWGSGNAIAVGEYDGTAPSSYSMTFGTERQYRWQVTTNSASSYSTVQTASAFNDGTWFVGSPPSPFTISR